MLRKHRQIQTQLQKLVDASIFGIAFYIAYFWRTHWKLEIFGGSANIGAFAPYVWMLLIIIPIVPLVLEFQGYYNRKLISSRQRVLWVLCKSCLIVTLAIILTVFLFRIKEQKQSRSVIILFGFVSLTLMLLKEEGTRALVRYKVIRRQPKRLILAGLKKDTAKLREDLGSHDWSGVEIVMEIDLNETSVEQMVEFIHEHSVNGVVLNANHTVMSQLEKVVQACELEGVETWLIADFFRTQISRTSIDDFYGKPVLVFRSGPDASWQGIAKQIMDRVGALVLVLFLSPLLLFCAVAIRLGSRGPVLFCQRRSGLNGEPFIMYKFRSMVTDAEQRKHEFAALNEMSGPVFKLTNDPRVTPVGRWLRRSSLDELPQLFNVLKGDMSLVGPRPLPVEEVKKFGDFAHRRRLSVKPGLTCLWQVSGRNNINDFGEWVKLDLEYIDNWSLWLDCKILWRTIPVVLLAKGAR